MHLLSASLPDSGLSIDVLLCADFTGNSKCCRIFLATYGLPDQAEVGLSQETSMSCHVTDQGKR